MIWLFAGLLGALVAIHMTRPRFERRVMSAARFFKQLPPIPPGRSWKLSHLLFSRAFYLQLLSLLLLLAALLIAEFQLASGTIDHMGVWVLVDTSASMSTEQGDTTRLALALAESARVVDQAEQAGRWLERCFRLSSFDLVRQDLLITRSPSRVRDALEALTVRALGTDLSLMRGLLTHLDDQAEAECPITHVVIVSDQPAPRWLTENQTAQSAWRVIWRDVGAVVDNIGLTRIDATRNTLTGLVREVTVAVTAFGVPPTNTKLVVTAPDGSVSLDVTLTWPVDQTWQGKFTPTLPGDYNLKLVPEDAYRYDNQATINISDGQTVRVDWKLSNSRLLAQLGWQLDTLQPHLRVVPQLSAADPTPSLVVGSGYQGGATSAIGDFYEASPLLADLNFDVIERLPIPRVDLPDGFQPVLRGTDDRIWLAQREMPPAAYVPGLPIDRDDNLGRFSTTTFFNAVRWLLRNRPLPSLYSLTSPEHPEPDGTRLALHPDEGNTVRPPASRGTLGELQPFNTAERENPLWPILLSLAMLIFLLERGLATFGGEAWR